jgi:hypothetical protein
MSISQSVHDRLDYPFIYSLLINQVLVWTGIKHYLLPLLVFLSQGMLLKTAVLVPFLTQMKFELMRLVFKDSILLLSRRRFVICRLR